MSNEFYFPKIVSSQGFVTFEVMCGSAVCTASMNFGADLNKNSKMDTAIATEKGCGMSFGSRSSGSVVAADGTTSSYVSNLFGAGTTWHRYRLLIDIQAGKMRVDYKSLYTTVAVNDSQWITQIPYIDAKFNWGATTAQNPSLWDCIFFSSCKEGVHVPWFTVTIYPVIGTYFNSTSLTLQACEAGTFWINSSFCQDCPVGTYSSATGMSVCSECKTGTYALTERSSSCTYLTQQVCEAGTFWTNSSFCQDCPIGTYSSATGMSMCSKCEIGTYAPTERSSSCTLCEAGTYMSDIGAATCVPCSAGNYSGGIGSTTCTPCAVGTYANSASSSVCSICEFGKYTLFIGSVICTLCLDCSQIGYYTTGCGGSSPGSCDTCKNS